MYTDNPYVDLGIENPFSKIMKENDNRRNTKGEDLTLN